MDRPVLVLTRRPGVRVRLAGAAGRPQHRAVGGGVEEHGSRAGLPHRRRPVPIGTPGLVVGTLARPTARVDERQSDELWEATGEDRIGDYLDEYGTGAEQLPAPGEVN